MVPRKLPPEILDEIIWLLPKATQLVLCRTSQLFHSLVLHSLYKNICLTRSSSLMCLCTTLRSNSTAAVCVKRLSISYKLARSPNTLYLASFYKNLKAALLQMVNLRELALLVFDPTFITTILSPTTQPLQFPLLNYFETVLPLDSSLLSFIQRHPTLDYLEVSHHENFSDDTPSRSRDCATVELRRTPVLRKLRHYAGNGVYLETLAPAYPLPLRSAHVVWSAAQACDGPIKSLSAAASCTLNVLSCRRRGWNSDLIGLISTHLPNIYMLDILCVFVVDAQFPTGYQEEVGHYLSRYPNLQHLRISREVQFRSSEIPCDLDHELAIVSEWGAKCPSLSVITLPRTSLSSSPSTLPTYANIQTRALTSNGVGSLTMFGLPLI
ncbi:hypothetical protein AN958_03366 [Leucoagaricus sp. SymC.cos]|nr:hypothetical protein AN958_03366 [Leucoagaricus sp. SymC.cos]